MKWKPYWQRVKSLLLSRLHTRSDYGRQGVSELSMALAIVRLCSQFLFWQIKSDISNYFLVKFNVKCRDSNQPALDVNHCKQNEDFFKNPYNGRCVRYKVFIPGKMGFAWVSSAGPSRRSNGDGCSWRAPLGISVLGPAGLGKVLVQMKEVHAFRIRVKCWDDSEGV